MVLERTIYYTLLDADIIEAESPIETLYRVAPQKARQLGLPNPNQTAAVKEKTSDAKLSEAILKTRDTLDVLAYELHCDGGDASKAQQQLNELHTQLQTQDEQAMAGFQKVGRHIEKHQLAAIIKERHQNAVESYRKDMDILLNNVQTALTAKDSKAQFEAVMAARKHLDGKQLERSQQPFDPNNLPHKSMQPNPDNKPKLTLQEFADAGLVNSPLTQYASHGSYNFGNLAGASNPAYLTETDEVNITPAIQARADELQHDPVLIYNWVRNNIEWIPIWGAMQDSDITLGSKRGNAMDISSLTIALLRASGIPSRYVHGTIELPAEKFKNWAGGFESTEAAADFAASGGIPTGIGIEGGIATVVRLEHIWVEAAIDYQPSRGAINRDADSWVQLDASYKQYEFLSGLDITTIASLDEQGLETEFSSSGLINEAEGWVSGLDTSLLTAAQMQVQGELENYIDVNLPNATMGEILGGRRILTQEFNMLASSISNQIVVAGNRYAQIPQQLQARVKFHLGRDVINLPIGEVELPWAKVNSYKVTLSFRPDSAYDEEAFRSLLPDGDITSINQLPISIPAYLINVVPELKLNGNLISSGQAIRLGDEINFGIAVTNVGHTPMLSEKLVLAGSYNTILTLSGNVSISKLEDLKERISETKGILESGDSSQISTLTREQALGDMFYTGSLGYMAQLQSISYMMGLKQKVLRETLPSTGSFGYVPSVNYFFGFPQSISPGGVEMDLFSLSGFTQSLKNSNKEKISYLLQVGSVSSMLEHTIPEQMFNDIGGTTFNEGISAVKLISKAHEYGQRIYRITESNKTSALNNINLDLNVKAEITSALNAGMEVITHTENISLNGYVGSGYIIFDPETGEGAYKISGGLNGGFLFAFIMTVIALIIAIAMILSGVFWIAVAGAFLLGFEILNIAQWINSINAAKNDADFNKANAAQFFTAFIASLPISRLLRIFGTAMAWLIPTALQS